MPEFVRALKGRCKCAVLSNDVTPRLLQTVRMFGIEDCFDMIVGGDAVAKHKPDPLGARSIMESLGVGPEHTAMIGDSGPDMEMGRRAGVRHIIAIRSDITGIEAINQAGALLIDNYRMLRVQQVI
jgi:HAD superfamily hydrolase (TIGR01549 family)